MRVGHLSFLLDLRCTTILKYSNRRHYTILPTDCKRYPSVFFLFCSIFATLGARKCQLASFCSSRPRPDRPRIKNVRRSGHRVFKCLHYQTCGCLVNISFLQENCNRLLIYFTNLFPKSSYRKMLYPRLKR